MNRFLVHSQIWAGNSEYFATAFSSVWSKKKDYNEISFTVDEDEVDAFEEIIRFFYFGKLRCDETTSVSYLLKLLHLADRLLANQCCTTIVDLIKAEVNGDIRPVTREDILNFFGFAISDSKENLNSFFTEALVNELGALETIFDTDPIEDDRKRFFLGLPLCAIVSLLSLDSLNATCENIVLSVAIRWVSSSGENCTSEDFTKLRQCIYMASLDLAVINEVISRVQWLKISPMDKEHLISSCHVLAQFPPTGIDFDSEYTETNNEMPFQWFKTRVYAIPCVLDITMRDVQIDEAIIANLDLDSITDSTRTFQSQAVRTWRGFAFSCKIFICASGIMAGAVICTFPSGNEEQPIHMRVKLHVTLGTKQLGTFYQMTCQYFGWHNSIVPEGRVSLEQFKETFGIQNFPATLTVSINQVYI